MGSHHSLPEAANYKRETILVLAYFSLYLASLFFTRENEFIHWMTLVIAPFTVLYFYQKRNVPTYSITETLKSVGIEQANFRTGLILGAVIGLLLSLFQLYFSRDNNKIFSLIISGKFIYLWPIAFTLMFVTAGFTEEFFFRGILQTRLQQWTDSKTIAVIISSILFGVYHLPYAYLNPHWPSYGNFSAALSSAAGIELFLDSSAN